MCESFDREEDDEEEKKLLELKLNALIDCECHIWQTRLSHTHTDAHCFARIKRQLCHS